MAEASTLEAPIVVSGEGVTETINSGALELLTTGEPSWLAERRRSAWEIYERTPMPTTRLEEWRYTDLSRKLKLTSLVPAPAGAHDVPPDAYPRALRRAMKEDWAAAGHVVEIDGRVVHTDLDPELAARGVVLGSLRAAAETHEDLLSDRLAVDAIPPERGKFSALNAALWTDGILLYVPRNVHVELPIRVSRWVTEPGAAYFTRTLIIADTGCDLSFVEETLSPDFDAQTLLSSAVELFARDNARVKFVSLQRMGRGAFHLSDQCTLVGRDATTDTLNVNLGATTARLDLDAKLLGPGATCEMFGLYFGDEKQHFDHNTSQDHVAPNSTSDLLYKGALDGKSRSVFRGMIKVHPSAQRTDAYQTNRNLLLSEHASADSQPNLEIEADDVRCSHGATVGQLDEEALFYLLSRGLSRTQAERLVVLGFLGDVLARLPLGGVTAKVTRAIEEKLGA